LKVFGFKVFGFEAFSLDEPVPASPEEALSRLALAGQRFARLGSCFVADFCRRTGIHFGEIC